MRLPSRIAESRRFRRMTPAPSPRPYPSAAAENDFDLPSAARNWPLHMVTIVAGEIITFAPPTIESSQPSYATERYARWVATRDDEHPVSTVMLGPWRSKVYEIRFDRIVSDAPTAVCASRRRRLSSLYSRFW